MDEIVHALSRRQSINRTTAPRRRRQVSPLPGRGEAERAETAAIGEKGPGAGAAPAPLIQYRGTGRPRRSSIVNDLRLSCGFEEMTHDGDKTHCGAGAAVKRDFDQLGAKPAQF